jgi:RNA polymerase sigma-70 factor (ECF subfamily)
MARVSERIPGVPVQTLLPRCIADRGSTSGNKGASDIECSDETLIGRICTDDSEALGLLFRRYSRLVWAIARKILGNNEEANDLVQDVFLLVRRKASVFDPSKGSTRSLLVQISYQRAFTRRRDLSRQHFYSSNEVKEHSIIPNRSHWLPLYDKGLEAQVGKMALKNALESLSPEQWETLRLYFFEGYTLEEIAVRKDLSYENVRHHYYRGLNKLRRCLCQE